VAENYLNAGRKINVGREMPCNMQKIIKAGILSIKIKSNHKMQKIALEDATGS